MTSVSAEAIANTAPPVTIGGPRNRIGEVVGLLNRWQPRGRDPGATLLPRRKGPRLRTGRDATGIEGATS